MAERGRLSRLLARALMYIRLGVFQGSCLGLAYATSVTLKALSLRLIQVIIPSNGAKAL